MHAQSAADWLAAAGFAGPVYVHSDVAIPKQVERRKGAHRDDLAHALGSVEQVKCEGSHWLSSCLDAIRLDHGMPANAQFKPIAMDFKGRRKPLSKETAKHLGEQAKRTPSPVDDGRCPRGGCRQWGGG